MVSLTATDLIVALKKQYRCRQNIEKSGSSVCPCAYVSCRQNLLTFILCVVLMKLAIQALMSNFTPTTGDQTQKARHPRSCWTSVLTLLSELRKCKLGQRSQKTRQVDVWCVCVCVHMSEQKGEKQTNEEQRPVNTSLSVCVCVCQKI